MLRWLLLACIMTSAPAAGDTAGVSFDGERLSVEFRGVSLADGLRQITDETGITFKVDPGVSGSLNARFQGLPINRAIPRLLRSYSHILLYETVQGTDQVATVIILPEGSQQTNFPPPEPEDEGEQPVDEQLLDDAQPPTDDTGITPEQQSNFVKPETSGSVATSGTRGSQVVKLRRHASGHYLHQGRINGHGVTFLVDTGATAVALPESLAGSLGVRRGASRTVLTAAGPTQGYQAKLEIVEIGGLSLRQVDAIILPGLELGQQVLLGMSFLAGFELLQREDVLIIRELD